MNEWRENATAVARDGSYDVALDIIDKQAELGASDLVLKGRLIQLSTGGEGREVDDAAAAFHRALLLDPEYVPALLELGWMYFSVFDDPKQAKEHFDRAISIVRRQAIEALRGSIQCAEQIGGPDAHAEAVRRASSLISDSDLEDLATDGF
jgi:tetratricopeptide (TPR) repeat protein